MNNQIIVEKINQLITLLLPDVTFQKTFYLDEGSFINYYFIIDNYLGIELNIDFMDRLISFYMIKLDNGKPYEYGYSTNSKAGTIRLHLQSVFKYFNLPFDKSKSKQLMYFKENEDALIERIRETILLYSPIFQNAKAVISELHIPEIWEKIK